MRSLVILALAAASSAFGQFRLIEIHFRDIGCASCIESLPPRMQRMRGVENAKVDPKKSLLTLELSDTNKVRLEQVRDNLEQDGTKSLAASVRVNGILEKNEQGWLIRPVGLGTAAYPIDVAGAKPALRKAVKEGLFEVTGEIANLRPEGGPIRIALTALKPVNQ